MVLGQPSTMIGLIISDQYKKNMVGSGGGRGGQIFLYEYRQK